MCAHLGTLACATTHERQEWAALQVIYAHNHTTVLLCRPASCCSALSGLLGSNTQPVLKSEGPSKSDCPTSWGPRGAAPGQALTRARTRAGFRITACAATPDQAAFVLSVPRRRPMDETQETLRTSAFPSTHVKDKCAPPPRAVLVRACHGPCLSLSGQLGRWAPSCLLQQQRRCPCRSQPARKALKDATLPLGDSGRCPVH